VSTERPGSEEFFGDGSQYAILPNAIFSFELFKGSTAFKPRDWALRITPQFNLNYVNLRERNGVNATPEAGITRRRQHVALLVSADRFLHHMVRTIVGSAVAFNMVNAGLNGLYLGWFGAVYPTAWLTDPRFIVGLAVFAAMLLILNRTKIGLLIRAGVENKEMVEALGYRIRRLFVAVFVVGAALAGLGGALWGMYQESVTASIGAQMMVLIFIVIIIGGLGSVGGCFVGALLVGLVANYVGYLSPKIALGSNILLMVMILLWRPQGLYPMSKQ